MNSKKSKVLILALLLPVLVLLALTIKPVLTLQFGETIQLETTPFDPTDLFRGDYVDLFYDMNQIDLSKVKVEGLPSTNTPDDLRGKRIYALLQKSSQGSVYEVDKYVMQRPKTGIYLQGMIRNAYYQGMLPGKGQLAINIDYGIDRYFIQENTGAALENMARQGKVLVTLKIYHGYGMVTALEEKK